MHFTFSSYIFIFLKCIFKNFFNITLLEVNIWKCLCFSSFLKNILVDMGFEVFNYFSIVPARCIPHFWLVAVKDTTVFSIPQFNYVCRVIDLMYLSYFEIIRCTESEDWQLSYTWDNFSATISSNISLLHILYFLFLES